MKTRDSKVTSSSYGAELSEILADLNSSEMRRFCAACDALSCREETGFELLKPYRSAKDIYRKLYVFKVIYRNPYAAAIDDWIEEELESSDIRFVSAALMNIIDFQKEFNEDKLRYAVKKNYKELSTQLYVLSMLSVNTENYIFLQKLYRKLSKGIQEDIVSDVLIRRYGELYPQEIFDLLSKSRLGKVRAKSVRFAREKNLDYSTLINDMDGHVRKAIEK